MLTQPKQEVPGEAAVSRRAFGRSKGDLPFNLDSNNMSRRAREKCLSDKARGSKPGGPPHLAGDVDAGITGSVLLPAVGNHGEPGVSGHGKRPSEDGLESVVPSTAETAYSTVRLYVTSKANGPKKASSASTVK